MFTSPHFIYLFISLATIAIAIFFLKNVKEKTRIIILRITSLLMLIIHLSPIVTRFFGQMFPLSGLDAVIWPIFFCNVSLWLFAITFLSPKVLKKLYPIVINFAFIGGLLTLTFPQFHPNTTNIFDWFIFRSYLSHSLMLFGACFAYFSKEYQPRVKDIITVFIGLISYLLWGIFTNYIFLTYKRYPVNSMYLQAPIFEGTVLYWHVDIVLVLLVTFTFFVLYEHFTLKKENRTIYKLIKKISKN